MYSWVLVQAPLGSLTLFLHREATARLHRGVIHVVSDCRETASH